MKLPYKLTRSSKATLRQIGIDTKKNFGDKQAKKYLKDLYEFFSLLAGNPEVGRERAEISKHTRSIPRGSHVIYYQDNAAPLVIFRIRHKSVDTNPYRHSVKIDKVSDPNINRLSKQLVGGGGVLAVTEILD